MASANSKRGRKVVSVSVDSRVVAHLARRASRKAKPISREVEYLILRGLADCGDMVPGMTVDEAA